MNGSISRRSFVTSATGSLAFASLAGVALAQSPTTQPQQAKKDKGPPIAPQLVREFVGAGHAKLDRCREMLEQYPTIVNACWDWGNGDYETALGGASHMGRPDIANFLIERGARMDVFAAAMLGKLDIVRAACAAFPNTRDVPGPHGITLIEHARKGGEPARAVLAFLESLG
jgi:hypothetical protein